MTLVKKGFREEATKSCQETLMALENDIENINYNIDQIIKSDDRLNRLNQLITSVPCIGRIMAIQVNHQQLNLGI